MQRNKVDKPMPRTLTGDNETRNRILLPITKVYTTRHTQVDNDS